MYTSFDFVDDVLSTIPIRFDLLHSKFACDTGVGHLSTDSIRRRRIIYPRANLNLFKIGIEAAWPQDHVLMRRKKKNAVKDLGGIKKFAI